MAAAARTISVKGTAFGQDMLEALAERQLEKVSFSGLDISKSILTLKEYLVKKLSNDIWKADPSLCQPELRCLYPIYFDSVRVLLAECVAEFFQTSSIYMAVLDPYSMEYAEHEIRALILRPEEVSSLLRALKKVRAPGHDQTARWKNPSDQERWVEHIQELHQAMSKLQ